MDSELGKDLRPKNVAVWAPGRGLRGVCTHPDIFENRGEAETGSFEIQPQYNKHNLKIKVLL